MLVFLYSSIAFIFALGVIVFVHEMGHFLTAKAFGVRVMTFSLGFGKRLWGFNYRGTDCRVSAVPLGGYVRLGGEHPDERSDDPRDFLNRPRWQRIIVYLAGPAMNVVLSLILITYLFMDGFPPLAMEDSPSVVGWVEEDGPAQAAGLQVGDRIVQIEGDPVKRWNDVSFAFMTSPEKPVELIVERDEERLPITVLPDKVERYEFGYAGVGSIFETEISEVVEGGPADRAGFRVGDLPRLAEGRPLAGWPDFVTKIQNHSGKPIEIDVLREGELVRLTVTPEASTEPGGEPGAEDKGRIGVIGSVRLPLGKAIVASARFNIEIVQRSVQILGKLFTRDIKAKSALSGPIEIANISGQAARRGPNHLIFTMGFLSISIGFMNLLPIPVLDGGHIFLLLIESLMRRDLSVRLKERVTQFGFMMLMTLMAVVIFFDLTKILP